jgi:hypothetical protein
MLHIFTYCTNKDNVKLLEYTAQLKNIKLTVIYEPQSEYKGYINKIFKIREMNGSLESTGKSFNLPKYYKISKKLERKSYFSNFYKIINFMIVNFHTNCFYLTHFDCKIKKLII